MLRVFFAPAMYPEDDLETHLLFAAELFWKFGCAGRIETGWVA